MDRLAELLLLRGDYFNSGTSNSPEFLSFYRNFKKEFNKELKEVQATGVKYHKGHFNLTGFFKVKDQIWYFSLSDVRGHDGQLLYRTAEHYKDWTGGHNQYVKIEQGMINNMRL